MFGEGEQKNGMGIDGGHETIGERDGTSEEIGGEGGTTPASLDGAHEGDDITRVLEMRAEIDMVGRVEEFLETFPREDQSIIFDIEFSSGGT